MRSETQGHGLCVSSPQMLRVTETDVHLDPQGGYIWEEHHRTLQIQYIFFSLWIGYRQGINEKHGLSVTSEATFPRWQPYLF